MAQRMDFSKAINDLKNTHIHYVGTNTETVLGLQKYGIHICNNKRHKHFFYLIESACNDTIKEKIYNIKKENKQAKIIVLTECKIANMAEMYSLGATDIISMSIPVENMVKRIISLIDLNFPQNPFEKAAAKRELIYILKAAV